MTSNPNTLFEQIKRIQNNANKDLVVAYCQWIKDEIIKKARLGGSVLYVNIDENRVDKNKIIDYFISENFTVVKDGTYIVIIW